MRVDGSDSGGGDGGSEMRRWIRNVHDGAAEERRGKDLYVQGRGEGCSALRRSKAKMERERGREGRRDGT